MAMDRIALVKTLLNEYGCLTSRQISVMANIRKNEDISAASAAGILKNLALKGEASYSKNEKGAAVYWLN